MPNENVNAAESTPAALEPPPLPPTAAPAKGPLGMSRKTQAFIADNLMLAVMFAGGILGVYLLSLRGGPAKASAEQLAAESQVDAAITSTKSSSPAAKANEKAIIERFSNDAASRQIPLDKLHKNPFIFTPGQSKTPTPEPVRFMPTPKAAPVDPELQSANAVFKTLSLQAILKDRTGKSQATISGNPISQGQMISGWTVSRITETEVELTWRDQKRTLKMSE